jgi:heterodisulfide reductase subunit B
LKIAYYPGCSLEATAKEYDLSARTVCRHLGLEMAELQDWNCCGATSAHSINHLLALALPARNLALAQEEAAQCLVAPCSACYNRLKTAAYVLQENEVERKKVEEVVGFKFNGTVNVQSLLETIYYQVGADTMASLVKKPLTGLKVVCYYGCLLVRPPEITGFDQTENPVILDKIVSSLGAEPLMWSYKTDCCGASLSLVKSDAVQEMVGLLLDMAAEAGAMAIVTACPLCQSNLEMRRKKPFSGIPAFFFTELIGLAFGMPEERNWWPKHLVDPFPLLRSLSLAG